MKERIHISPPGGPIDILGQKTDSSLLIDEVPYQFTFLREIGSTWRYQIAKSINELDLLEDRSFSNKMKYGFVEDGSLSDSFKYILDLLAPGEYELELTTIDHEIELLEIWDDNGSYNQTDTYGGMVEIIATQSYFDEQVINEYEGLINEGNAPVMVLFTADTIDDNYLIDGHHKFVAWSRLKKDARALQITRIKPAKIKKNLGLQLMDQCGQINKEYLKRYSEMK